jgi:hypothetical protein
MAGVVRHHHLRWSRFGGAIFLFGDNPWMPRMKRGMTTQKAPQPLDAPHEAWHDGEGGGALKGSSINGCVGSCRGRRSRPRCDLTQGCRAGRSHARAAFGGPVAGPAGTILSPGLTWQNRQGVLPYEDLSGRRSTTVAPQPPPEPGSCRNETTAGWSFKRFRTISRCTPIPLPWTIRTVKMCRLRHSSM